MSERTPEHINFRRWAKGDRVYPTASEGSPSYHNRGWKLKCLYPKTRYSIERMQTNLRGITNR